MSSLNYHTQYLVWPNKLDKQTLKGQNSSIWCVIDLALISQKNSALSSTRSAIRNCPRIGRSRRVHELAEFSLIAGRNRSPRWHLSVHKWVTRFSNSSCSSNRIRNDFRVSDPSLHVFLDSNPFFFSFFSFFIYLLLSSNICSIFRDTRRFHAPTEKGVSVLRSMIHRSEHARLPWAS